MKICLVCLFLSYIGFLLDPSFGKNQEGTAGRGRGKTLRQIATFATRFYENLRKFATLLYDNSLDRFFAVPSCRPLSVYSDLSSCIGGHVGNKMQDPSGKNGD